MFSNQSLCGCGDSCILLNGCLSLDLGGDAATCMVSGLYLHSYYSTIYMYIIVNFNIYFRLFFMVFEPR